MPIAEHCSPVAASEGEGEVQNLTACAGRPSLTSRVNNRNFWKFWPKH